MSVRVLWEPRDLWVGVYWTTRHDYIVDANEALVSKARELLLYVCLIPCLPILVRVSL